MRFSGQPDPLTKEDKRKLETFYADVLKNGYAQYPLNKDKISLYINGVHKRIYGDPKWSIQAEYIYIGYSRDEGSEDFAQPMFRLACISALMGITGHANKPELIALLSERLAKVMAGVYDTVVKPLATTSDSRPVRRMAWSTGGGLATWFDGAWVGLTGEPVEVGSDWIVVDTGEGPVEDGLPVTRGQEVVEREVASSFADMCRVNRYSTRTTADGREFVHFHSTARGEAREVFTALQNDGYQLEWVEEGIWVGFAEALPSTAEPTPLTHAQWEEIKERFDEYAVLWTTNFTTDGRTSVSFGDSLEEHEERIIGRQLIGCVVEMDRNGNWAITYPPEPPQRNVEEVELFPF